MSDNNWILLKNFIELNFFGKSLIKYFFEILWWRKKPLTGRAIAFAELEKVFIEITKNFVNIPIKSMNCIVVLGDDFFRDVFI